MPFSGEFAVAAPPIPSVVDPKGQAAHARWRQAIRDAWKQGRRQCALYRKPITIADGAYVAASLH